MMIKNDSNRSPVETQRYAVNRRKSLATQLFDAISSRTVLHCLVPLRPFSPGAKTTAHNLTVTQGV
jgi:hypothetical protein